MAMTTLTPQQISDKWKSNLSAATTSITAGVNGVTQAPGQKAAASADFWLARVTAAKQKYATNVGKVTLQQWKDAMLNVGVPRIAQGASANQGKVTDFMTKFLPFLASGVASLPPKGDLSQNIQRAVAMMTYTAGYTS